MKKISIIFLLVFVFSVLYTNLPLATDVFAQAKKSTKASDVGISYTLRKDKKAVTVTFTNALLAKQIRYTLLYKTQGRDEGAMGTIYPKKSNTESRLLLFGTCSKNVCRYHTQITNMNLEVTYTLKSGKKTTKNFNIKL